MDESLTRGSWGEGMSIWFEVREIEVSERDVRMKTDHSYKVL